MCDSLWLRLPECYIRGVFPEPPRPTIRFSKVFESWVVGRVSLTEYKSKTRVQCAECVRVVHENYLDTGKMGGTLIGSARYRLRCDNGDLLICVPHANLWRLHGNSQ